MNFEGINAVGCSRKEVDNGHACQNRLHTWLGKIENELRSSAYQLKDVYISDLVEVETYVDDQAN